MNDSNWRIAYEGCPIRIEVRRELFARISAPAQKHFILQAAHGSIDDAGYTRLGFELEHARDAASLVVAIAMKRPLKPRAGEGVSS